MRERLDGIRVLDLTRNVAGPYCTMILGDLGADVIKVERPKTGDDTRSWSPPSWNGYSTTFLALNRNKRSLDVDMDQEEGQRVVRALAERADVIVESFRPGSLERRGLAYHQVRQANPGVVYCSISGFGSRGPYRDRAGYDPVIQAYSGIMSITGELERPPVRVGASIVDMGTGLWSAIGVLTALLKRASTGQGTLVETSLLEVGVGWVGYQLVGYLATGVVPTRMGSKIPMIAPYEAFPTKDGHLFVGAPNDAIFRRLCRAVELEELAEDERFRTNPNRVANRGFLHERLSERFTSDVADRWEEVLSHHQVPCSRIRSMDEVAEDEQVETMGMIAPFPHPEIADLRLVDLPVALDGQRASSGLPPPLLGEHTEEILRSIGYPPEMVERLRREGVIG